MYGILIIGHRNLPQVLFEIINDMAGELDNFDFINVYPDENPDKIKEQLSKKVKNMLNKYGNLLILTDMFGGTPSNLALSFLEKDKVEVITGVNLPMILKLRLSKDKYSLKELVDFIKNYGKRNICAASDILGI